MFSSQDNGDDDMCTGSLKIGAKTNNPGSRSAASVIAFLATYKAIYFLLIYLAIVLLPPIYSFATYSGNIHGPTMPSSIEKFFVTWDAQSYLFISQYGYIKGLRVDAFFPLWPFVIRLFSYVTGGNILVSSLILSNACSVAALFGLHRFVSRQYDSQLADRTIMLMLAFPGAIFLSFPYSESLFLLFCVLMFLQLSSHKYINAGILAFFAAMTRPLGVLLIAPMLVHIVKSKKFSALPSCLFPILGYGCYLAIMYLFTGNAFEGFAAQHYFFDNASVSKILNVVGLFEALRMPVHAHGLFDSAIDRAFFGLFCMSLWAIWRRDKTMFVFAFLMGVVPPLTVSMASFTRYVLIAFPMFLVIAKLFVGESRTNLFFLVLIALFGIQILFLILHMNFYWVA
jgi:hypothetical protein